jgi:predicted N-acetyltransferase YhbS
MTEHDSVVVRTMLEDDLPAADLLREIAGWNQMPADWLRILRYQPDGCFVATINGAIVGTVTTTTYPHETPAGESVPLAWIGMMLVHPDQRRKGIASALMQRSVDYLNDSGVQCIKLDATPVGEPVYARLGFQQEWCFNRWQKSSDDSPVLVPSSGPGSLCSELDLAAFGVDRGTWLNMLADDSTVIVNDNGFGMLRTGRVASYLGPITADGPAAAGEIADTLLNGIRGPVFWDMPSPNAAGEQLARDRGFEPVRDLTRMWMGKRLIAPELKYQFGLSDPGAG